MKKVLRIAEERCYCKQPLPWHLVRVGDSRYSHVCSCGRIWKWLNEWTLSLHVDPPVCPYCGEVAEMVDGTVVYPHRPDLSEKLFWKCPGDCDAYVGCHPESPHPMGRMANKELRCLKMDAHAAFDKLWKRELGGSMRRKEAYAWLADKMGIDIDECHIGMFDENRCRRVISLCREKESS